MIDSVKYNGNPVHEKHRGDFGLIPPAIHRPGKGLCDSTGIFRQKDALALIKEGLKNSPHEENALVQRIEILKYS